MGSRSPAFSATCILSLWFMKARVNDDRPLTAPEVVSALNQIKNRLRGFDCLQPGCSHYAASASEYLHHLNICGPYAGQIAAADEVCTCIFLNCWRWQHWAAGSLCMPTILRKLQQRCWQERAYCKACVWVNFTYLLQPENFWNCWCVLH